MRRTGSKIDLQVGLHVSVKAPCRWPPCTKKASPFGPLQFWPMSCSPAFQYVSSQRPSPFPKKVVSHAWLKPPIEDAMSGEPANMLVTWAPQSRKIGIHSDAQSDGQSDGKRPV